MNDAIDELLRSYAAEGDSRRRAGLRFADTARLPDGEASVICRPEDSPAFELRVAHRPRRTRELPPLPPHDWEPLHTIDADEDGSLASFRPLGRVDRWAMGVGLSRRDDLGEPDFDALVYVDADAPAAWVRSALGSVAARAAVVALVTSGLEVRINGGRAPFVSAVRPGAGKKALPSAAAAASWLASLSTVAQAVSSVPLPGPQGGGRRARMRYPFVLLVVSLVAFVASFLGPAGPHSATDPACDAGICFSCDNPVVGAAQGNLCFWQSPPVKWGLLGGIAVAAGIVLAYAHRLRGPSNAHVVLVQSLFFPVLFLALSGMGIGSTVDALLFGR